MKSHLKSPNILQLIVSCGGTEKSIETNIVNNDDEDDTVETTFIVHDPDIRHTI